MRTLLKNEGEEKKIKRLCLGLSTADFKKKYILFLAVLWHVLLFFKVRGDPEPNLRLHCEFMKSSSAIVDWFAYLSQVTVMHRIFISHSLVRTISFYGVLCRHTVKSLDAQRHNADLCSWMMMSFL